MHRRVGNPTQTAHPRHRSWLQQTRSGKRCRAKRANEHESRSPAPVGPRAAAAGRTASAGEGGEECQREDAERPHDDGNESMET